MKRCGRAKLVLLNQEKLPGCIYHRTAVNDVARTEGLTYICSRHSDDAGPTNNWMPPEEGYSRAGEILKGSMRGRTMYVVPFSMGPIGSPFSKIGGELTDSIYVVLNMRIMTRAGKAVLRHLGSDGQFTRCLHGQADLDIDRRLILHFPADNAIWSCGSGYGGNVLLGKKSLGLRIASYLGRGEGWLAEHMLIMGVEHPDGRIEYIAAAFPSGCGKTNLAMLVPPEGLKHKGYRIWTVGDDIAWMRIDADGRLWAINPESGFFGIAPGTNMKSNPNMMRTIARNTIYTNELLTNDCGVWWEGGEGEPPEGTDWQGRPWKPGMKDPQGKPLPGAHPNSRFTAPLVQCPSATKLADDPRGVPISAIIFGARQASLAPLVYEAFDWEHGVYIGATMASERTAAQVGKQGEVRRDPMAMLPFCGYNMGDYFEHWLEIGRRTNKLPRIFHVNWFRKDENGKFLWPGYGENLRVIEWILDCCRGEADAVRTPIGYVPTPESLDLTGLKIPAENLEKLFYVNLNDWSAETEEIAGYFRQFGERLPKELWNQNGNAKATSRNPAKLTPLERRNPHAGQGTQRDHRSARTRIAGTMLSELGKRLFFSSKGIPSAEPRKPSAKAKRHDATIGIAREKGKPMFLPSIMKYFNDLTPSEALTYAPGTGRPDLRKKWREEMIRKNPSLADKSFSLPIVTGGVTHALSLVGDLFLDRGDMVLLPDKFWENYDLLYSVRMQAQLGLFPIFSESGGFNVAGLRQALAARPEGSKTLVVLNFPNNPTGYSITAAEADEIITVLKEAAEALGLGRGTDDAYFGLFYGDDPAQEYAALCAGWRTRTRRILAVKPDGPSKEEFVWGLRTGMPDLLQHTGGHKHRSTVPGAGEEGLRGDSRHRFQLFSRGTERTQ